MSDWNLRKRRNYKYNYYSNEEVNRATKKTKSQNDYKSFDTINRDRVLSEIEYRIKIGEEINDITKNIAEREETKQQFSYLIKQGIIDLSEIFKNWYLGKQKNKGKSIDLGR